MRSFGIVWRPVACPAAPVAPAFDRLCAGRPGGVGRGFRKEPRARVACGQVAKIIGVGEPPAWIRFVSTTVDPTTQQGEARVFVGANPKLRTGTFARAIVTLGQSCGIAIPLSGVLYGKEGPVVQVVRGERVQTRAITTGPTFDGKVQVNKGLTKGDVVVIQTKALMSNEDTV